MKNIAFQARVPEDLLERLAALLSEKYAPMPPPSRNAVIVLALRELVERMETEKLSENEQVRARRGRKSATS